MSGPFELADFDAHEDVHFVCDRATGLRAIIAVHSTHLGPAAGGTRFWHYAHSTAALTDALRLSRGMSYKNAMAGLPLGGGKAVVLAREDGTKTTALLEAFGNAIDALGGRYVTAEDVGMSERDMQVIATRTRHVSGLPVDGGAAGGDPGPLTALGVYLGVKAAAKRALGTDTLRGVRVAVQGVGSVGAGLAHRLTAEGAVLTLADVATDRVKALADELGAALADPATVLGADVDIVSPCALGAVLDAPTIARMRAKVVAGAANNQLATPADADAIHARGILYAPDYVINAGGIINVGLEYLGMGNRAEVEARIAQIPLRLEEIWTLSAVEGRPAADVADSMAQRLIGRG